MVEAQLSGTIRHCTGCAATMVFDGPMLSLMCSYCDSPMVDDDRAAASIDAIVPFQIPQRGALDRIRIHLDGRRWAPRELRQLVRVVGLHGHGVRGVLVPFWVYDGVVRSDYRAKIGVDWTRRETYTDEHGKSQTRAIRETEWSTLHGTAARQIEDHVISASVGLPAHEANPLEPFDLGRAVAFDPRLLAGFEAELASVVTADAEPLAVAQLREAEAGRIQREQLPGDRNRLDSITSKVEIHARRLVLLPVWIASYRHGDMVLRLLVNGQTGEVVGRVPVSKAKLAIAVSVAVTLAAVVAWLLVWARGGW